MLRGIQRYTLLRIVNDVRAEITGWQYLDSEFLTQPLRSIPSHSNWLVSIDAIVHDAVREEQ